MVGTQLTGKKIAFLATDGVEQVELTQPWEAVKQAGGQPELVSLESGRIQGVNHMDKGDTFPVDKTVNEVMAADYDGLVLPGGVMNPDVLRTNPRAVEFVRFFFERAKPVAAICHGPWTLVEADAVRGRTLTSWPSLQTDIPERGWDLGRRGGPYGSGAGHQPQARRPSGVLRQAGRGVCRGRAPASGRGRRGIHLGVTRYSRG